MSGVLVDHVQNFIKDSSLLLTMMLRNLTFLLVMIDSRIVENDTLIMRMDSYDISMQDLRQIKGYLCKGMGHTVWLATMIY